MGFFDKWDNEAEQQPDGPPPEIRHTTETTPYGKRALDNELDTLSQATEGTRNHALNTAAFAIYQLVETGHIARADADESIGRTARMIGLTPSEIAKTMQSAQRGGAAKPRVNAPNPDENHEADTPPVTILRAVPDNDTDNEPDVTPGGDAEFIARWAQEHFPILDWRAEWDIESTEEWILEPLVPARRMVALYSPPKAGKSILMLELAASIATGRSVLGATPRQCRVLYVDYENDPREDTISRLKKMGYKKDELDDLIVIPYPAISPMDTARGGQELLALAQYHEVELVIIDTVSRTIQGEENENNTWLAFYRLTGLPLKKAGISLLRLDHAGKDVAKGQRGGSAKLGDIDAVWRLDKVDDHDGATTLTLNCEAQRFSFQDTFLTITRKDWPLRHEVQANAARAAIDAKVDACVEALEMAGVPKTVSTRDALKALRAHGWRGRNTIVQSALQRRGGTILEPGDDE